MPSQLKKLMADELTQRYAECSDCVIVSHTKLSGVEGTELRKILRERGVRMEVVKNRIAARVLKESGKSDVLPFIEGPSALVTGDAEMPDICKVLSECVKKFEDKLVLRGGLMGDTVLTADGVERLASIPPMPVLQARIVGGIQGPVVGVAMAFQSVLRGLACALGEIKKQKEGGAAPPATP